MRQSQPPQIHQQERQVVENVDRGDVVVELNRIEQGRLAVKQHDVAEVKVAVAVANQPIVTTLIQQDAAAIEHKPRAIGQPRAPDGIRGLRRLPP